jgi:hypothetical protein
MWALNREVLERKKEMTREKNILPNISHLRCPNLKASAGRSYVRADLCFPS